MSSASYPFIGGGGGIPTYPDFASLPATAADGAAAITLDSDSLYIFNLGSMMWILAGGSGVPLSVGSFDGQPESADGATIASNQLFMQSADATHPGLVNNTTQTLSGNKTFTGTIAASNLSGTNTGDVTLGTPNGLSLAGQALSLGTASTSTTGALTSTDWNSFNGKQVAGNYITALTGDGAASGPGSAALTLAIVNSNVGSFSPAVVTVNAKGLVTAASSVTTGNLTDVGTDGITVTGGTGAILGSGTSISQHVADATHNGYLSSTDWGTFNGKQAAGNYITALTGDVTASGPGSAASTLATVNSNVGSFTNANITVNAKGLITAASNGTSTAVFVPPSVQRLTSAGSGTYNKDYTFIISSGSATAGATYTNNGVTFTVTFTVSSATQIVMSGSGAPASSGTLTKTGGTGDATLTFSQFLAPLYLRVKMVGGGGGGAGSGTTGQTSGGAGGDSTFGSSLLTAGGGGGGVAGANGGAGGTNTINAGAIKFVDAPGGNGGGPVQRTSGTQVIFTSGGLGGVSFYGGAGVGTAQGGGVGAKANSGSGGGVGGLSNTASAIDGAGGGAGGYLEAVITSPAATYSYTVGAFGTAGANGTSGAAGSPGGLGLITVEEYYQ